MARKDRERHEEEMDKFFSQDHENNIEFIRNAMKGDNQELKRELRNNMTQQVRDLVEENPTGGFMPYPINLQGSNGNSGNPSQTEEKTTEIDSEFKTPICKPRPKHIEREKVEVVERNF